MLYYRRPSDLGPGLPSWLDGYEPRNEHAVRRSQTRSHYHVAVCTELATQPPDGCEWRAVEDGWQVACEWGPWSAHALVRQRQDITLLPAEDCAGRVWYFPMVLEPWTPQRAARPAFDTRLGEDWRPVLEDWQDRALRIAEHVRGAIETRLSDVLETGEIGVIGFDLPTEDAARATCELLCIANHLSPRTIQHLRVIDYTLMGRVLPAAAGIHRRAVEVVNGGGGGEDGS